MASEAMGTGKAGAAGKPGARPPKTAVVMIHGMGEQWPMETLRGFVEAAWTRDPEMVWPGANDQIYSKPDTITGSFELRRITTRDWSGKAQRRVDFFEFYWAHLMQGNTPAAVTGWLRRLLVRPRSRVPDRLVGGWIAGLVILALAAAYAALVAFKWAPEGRLWGVLWALLGFAAAFGVADWLVPVVGDAARYLSPAPGNVAARQAIREAGIDLLAQLHACGDYDRIVVVGHSLGSVIGYDMLHYAWGRIGRDDFGHTHLPGSDLMARLNDLEAAARDLTVASPPPGARAAYRKAQRAYFGALAKVTVATPDAPGRRQPLWLVSDYVTLGCPLSSSDVLMAKDAADLKAKKAIRDLPTSPPWLEEEAKNLPGFSYPAGAPARIPHHAAVFGPTVWTNVYFPSEYGLSGDFISGPVATQLGPGVRDVRVPIGAAFKFRHLDYWSKPASLEPWIKALRRAINLRGYDEATLWGPQADADPVAAELLADRIVPRPPPRRKAPPPGAATPSNPAQPVPAPASSLSDAS
jgi:hypothetical protein